MESSGRQARVTRDPGSGDPWRVARAPVGALGPYRFVIVFGRYEGQWLYVRQRDHQTWEPPGGHVEPGETPGAAACRELWEETGATEYTLQPAFDYAVHSRAELSYGRVYIADVTALGGLPPYEIAEVRPHPGLPEPLTYPAVTPVLYEWVRVIPQRV